MMRRRFRPALRLGPLLGTIDDPFLRALCQQALAWTSTIDGDVDGALREASASLAGLRGQDEPFWTASAGITLGSLETAVGRYDDALGHLSEVRDLGSGSTTPGSPPCPRCSWPPWRSCGAAEEARTLLDEALGPEPAAHSTRGVTLCLAALARWALVAGDPERAALVAGAAEGLRRRAGLRVWPMMRPEETELAARSARRWARTGSANCPPRAPGSPSKRRWLLPGPARRQHLADGVTREHPAGGGLPVPANVGTSRGRGVRRPQAAFGRLACRLTCPAETWAFRVLLPRDPGASPAREYGLRVIICSRQRTKITNEGRDGQLARLCRRGQATRRAVAIPAGFPCVPDRAGG